MKIVRLFDNLLLARSIRDILPAVSASLTPDSKVGRGGAMCDSTLTVSGSTYLSTLSAPGGDNPLFVCFFVFVVFAGGAM